MLKKLSKVCNGLAKHNPIPVQLKRRTGQYINLTRPPLVKEASYATAETADSL
jgi:hypothetical protein